MNIQTLPRKDKLVKRAFLPKLDELIFADYNQIEMRIMAYYLDRLGDSKMADILRDPKRDLHTETAKGVFILDREPTDPERQLAKNLNFTLIFLGGKPAVKKYLAEFNAQGGNIPATWHYAGKILEQHQRQWPGIESRLKPSLEAAYRERGYIKTVAGARLHPLSARHAVNSVIQSSAAECMRRALRTCHRELRGMESHLVCVIHDELVFDCVSGERDYIIANLPEWMDYAEVSEFVPTTISIESSTTNWAEKEEV